MKKNFEIPSVEVRELTSQQSVMSGALLLSADQTKAVYVLTDKDAETVEGYKYWKGLD